MRSYVDRNRQEDFGQRLHIEQMGAPCSGKIVNFFLGGQGILHKKTFFHQKMVIFAQKCDF
jgi:hypothetical protein